MTFFAGDLIVTDEAASASSPMPNVEQTGLQLEFTSSLVSVPAISLAAATTGLQLSISTKSLSLVVDLDPMITSPTTLVANMLSL